MPSPMRRFGLYGLILLALTLVSIVVFVIVTDKSVSAEDDIFPPEVTVDPELSPKFVFPESVRTFDTTLNRFVDHFARVCVTGDYSDFRLLYTRHDSPAPPGRFVAMFHAINDVNILALEKLPFDHVPDHPDLQGPVYIMLAEYDLEPYADPEKTGPRRIRLAIAKEEGEWRIGPIPSKLRGMLEAALQETQPAGNALDVSERIDAEPERPSLKTSANRPASIGS
ncbi:MAG: hypothetical protein O7D94_11180 [Planctomycetota bacterium]|nr:hypothetical protein [Planctomycetota bacterium]